MCSAPGTQRGSRQAGEQSLEDVARRVQRFAANAARTKAFDPGATVCHDARSNRELAICSLASARTHLAPAGERPGCGCCAARGDPLADITHTSSINADVTMTGCADATCAIASGREGSGRREAG